MDHRIPFQIQQQSHSNLDQDLTSVTRKSINQVVKLMPFKRMDNMFDNTILISFSKVIFSMNGLYLDNTQPNQWLKYLALVWKFGLMAMHLVNYAVHLVKQFNWFEFVIFVDSICIILSFCFIWSKVLSLRHFFTTAQLLLTDKRRVELAAKCKTACLVWLGPSLFDILATTVVTVVKRSIWYHLTRNIPFLPDNLPLALAWIIHIVYTFSYCVHHYCWLSTVFLLHYLVLSTLNQVCVQFEETLNNCITNETGLEKLLPFWRKYRHLKSTQYYIFGPVWFMVIALVFNDCIFRLVRETTSTQLSRTLSQFVLFWGNLIWLLIILLFAIKFIETLVIAESQMIESMSTKLMNQFCKCEQLEKKVVILLHYEINRSPRFNPSIWYIVDIRLSIVLQFAGAVVPLSESILV